MKTTMLLTIMTLWLTIPLLIVGFLVGAAIEAEVQGCVYARYIFSTPFEEIEKNRKKNPQ